MHYVVSLVMVVCIAVLGAECTALNMTQNGSEQKVCGTEATRGCLWEYPALLSTLASVSAFLCWRSCKENVLFARTTYYYCTVVDWIYGVGADYQKILGRGWRLVLYEDGV
jgi:hypothetical protein